MAKRGLRHRRKTPEGTVRLVFDNTGGMASDIRALAERESQCCGFLSFDVHVSNDVVLHVDAPTDKAEYLDMLYQAAEPDRPAGSRPSQEALERRGAPRTTPSAMGRRCRCQTAVDTTVLKWP